MGKENGTVNGIIGGLLSVSAINWGLVGALRFDLVAWLMGIFGLASAWLYIPIGLVGVWKLYDLVWG